MLSLPVMRWLSGLAVLLVVGHVCTFVISDATGIDRSVGMLRQLDLNGEANLAAWFYSFLLLSCSVLTLGLTVAARLRRSSLAGRWAVLAAVLLVMAVEETAQLHDMATGPLRNGLDIDFGVFYFAWLLPAVGFLAVCAVYFAPLVRSLGPAVQARFVGAVLVYLAGAVGVEMVSGFVASGGRKSAQYLAVLTVEEALELAGVLLVLGTLLALLRRLQPSVTVSLAGHGVGSQVVLDSPLPSAPRGQ